MMNSYLKTQECRLSSGAIVRGKWNRQVYTIVRKLGSGASGTVYLARFMNKLVALKIGTDHMSITSEVNVLKRFKKVQGRTLGPSLFEMDDVIISGQLYPFYAMEYINGTDFIHYIQSHGSEWIGVFIVQLLGDLEQLHSAGWAFGDLKPDNLLITEPPARIRWVDVGGTTLMGRAIKEYTEFFDRGYWGLGSRRAEPGYDLFAVAMIMINGAYPRRFERDERTGGLALLKEKVEKEPALKQYRHVIIRALQGKFKSAHEMRKEMLKGLGRERTSSESVRQKHSRVKQRRKKVKKMSYLIEVLLLSSFLLLLYILYLFGQMM